MSHEKNATLLEIPCTGSFGSSVSTKLVKMSHCWNSHVVAKIPRVGRGGGGGGGEKGYPDVFIYLGLAHFGGSKRNK